MKSRKYFLIAMAGVFFSEAALAKCSLRRYELSPRSIQSLQEIEGIADAFSDLEEIGYYTIALGSFRAILEGPKDASVPYQIYSEQWDLIGHAANGLSTHLRDQLKLVIDFERLRAGLSADERQFWADLRASISRKPIDPENFSSCGDPREAQTPAHKPEGSAASAPSISGGGGEGGVSSGPGFGGDIRGPVGGGGGGGGGGGIPCKIWDGTTCTIQDLR